MEKFMALCTFKEGTVMAEVFAVVAEEQAHVAALQGEGRVGAIHLSLPRGTVFVEIFAETVADADATVRTFPIAKWWNIDVYPIAAPAIPGAGS